MIAFACQSAIGFGCFPEIIEGSSLDGIHQGIVCQGSGRRRFILWLASYKKKKSEEEEEELAVVSDKLDIHNDFLFVMVLSLIHHGGHREYISLKYPDKQEIKTLCPLCPPW